MPSENRHGKGPAATESDARCTTSQAATEASEEHQKSPWRALFFFTSKTNLPVLAAGVLTSMLAGVATPAMAYVEGKLFEGFTSYAAGTLDSQEFFQHEQRYIYWLLAVSGASWLFNFMEMMIWIAFGELQAKSARDRLFYGLLHKEMAWYDLRKNGIGALLPRIQAQVRELQLATSQPLGAMPALLATTLLSLGQSLYLCWDLTLVTIATVPLIMFAVIFAGMATQRNLGKQQEKLTEAQNLCSSAFTAIETVKCYNGQAIEKEKYTKKILEAARFYCRVANANAVQTGLIVLLSNAMFVQGFYYGGSLISKGRKSVADVLTTFLSAVAAFDSLNSLVPTLLLLEKGRIAGSTLRTIVAEVQQKHDQQTTQNPITPRACTGNIDVRNLSFFYPALPQQLALNDVTMYLPAGEMTFLIGKSGSGKSTLGQLLMRFYQPNEGAISIDGVDIQRLDLHWLRTNVTLVEQNSTLFNETMHKNIAFGRIGGDQSNRSEVMQAAEFALLQQMIADMSDGLETMVGYKGGTMSGGQRQRMALARARLRNTPILVLDESTSALDGISRCLMMDAIRQWRQGKTTIVITHDITQIGPDDYAYILESGKLVQEGYRKHMENNPDCPFQGFLAPEQRVLSAPYDGRKGTNFESIRTRGSSIDSTGCRYSMLSSDPIETQLDASENKRTTMILNTFQNGPMAGVRAGTWNSPWMCLAASPAQITRRDSNPYTFSAWDDGTPISTEPTSDQSVRRVSQLLADLVDRTGQSAADSRRTSYGMRRRRREIQEQQRHTIDELPQSYGSATAREGLVNQASNAVKHKSYKQIIATVWPSMQWSTRLVFLAGCYATTIHSASAPTVSYLLSKLLHTYSVPGGDEQKALLYCMIMLMLACIFAVHSYLSRFCLEYAAQRWVDKLRIKALHQVLDQPRFFFDKEENSVSRLTENLDRNAEEARNLVGRFIALLWLALLMSTLSIVWCIVAQWKMTLIALIAAPYIFGVMRAYAIVSEKWESYSNTAAEQASSIFTETVTNIKTVRCLTLEGHFIQKYTKATNYALNVGLRRAFFTGFFYGVSDSAGNFAVTMVMYAGARLVTSGAPVQNVIQVFSMLILTIGELGKILATVPQMGATKDTASRLLRLVELVEDSHEHDGNARVTTIGPILFEDLNFSYPSRPGQYVLKNMNLRIQPGITTAIVGGSGSGKSTIANLLLNLYEVNETIDGYERNGDLLVGGRDIKHINTITLRSLIALVSQSPILFAASVYDNIAYGLPASSPYNSLAAVQAASKQAGCHEFIASLPQGYDTKIGDGGLALSGGQAQRIAIARALVRRPAVLILDEATSALDVESANLVRDTVSRLVRDRSRAMTVIIITHHRDMMAMADHVVVLDDGQVVEEGDFEELVGKNGALANLLSGGQWTGKEQDRKNRPRKSPFTDEIDWQKRRRRRGRDAGNR